MLDLSRYVGHTPGPWHGSQDGQDILPRDKYLAWLDGVTTYANKGKAIIESDSGVYGPYGADRRLIIDAPVLLQELIRLYKEKEQTSGNINT